MISILYGPKTTDFQNNGIGHLSDAVSCRVTEERNGLFELKMEYPVEGERFPDLEMSAIIMAEPAPGKDCQPFSIYKITKPLDGIVTVYAEHVSYHLSYIPVSPFSAASATSAMNGLKQNAAEECPFEVWTDMDAEGSFSVKEPASFRSRLGGNSGSILDVYGGELEFDNHTVKLWTNRGSDNGVTLRYGKNITDLKQEEYISNTITGIYPYWKGEEALVTLTEKIISADNAANFPYPRTIPLDMTSYFETQPAEDELRYAAQKYVKQNALGVPTVSLSVSFVALWQTEEYKTIAPLERVSLCDTVTVEYPKLGVSATAKVVRTVYDVLQGRYEKIDLGAIRSALEKTIVEQQKEISNKVSGSILANAVQNATNLLTGVKGGYIVWRCDGNGRPYELLVMDTQDVSTASKVIRLNQAGLGFSRTGINGPYTNAWTIDGKLVAEFITTCKLVAGSIGGWQIEEQAIYKDVAAEDGTIYRVYFQPPLIDSENPDKTWILSCQKSADGGKTFTGTFILYADGSAKFGDTRIQSDGTILFGGDLRILTDGSILWTNPKGGDYPAQITRQSDGTVVFSIGSCRVEKLSFTSIGGKKPKTGYIGVQLSDGTTTPLHFINGVLVE